MTKEQKASISQLRRAINKCYKNDIHLFGMDNDLLAVTTKGKKVFEKSGECKNDYGEDAAAYQYCQINGHYDETETVSGFGGCGGW